MKALIPPVAVEILKSELNEKTFLRKTNKANRSIYCFTQHEAPNAMLEVGRLRELSFRESGGGTGKEVDIDKYDLAEKPFKQLVVWDDDDEVIVGGYRYIEGYNMELNENGHPISATAKLFQFTEKFNKEYLPYTIELGRSFVQPEYQPTVNLRKGMFSLDNLWDGLGAVAVQNPDIKYLFGKFTMYTDFNTEARDIILSFLQRYFPDKDKMIYPFKSVEISIDEAKLNDLFTFDNYDEDYKVLVRAVRNLGENIPPLVNAYMNLSPTMKTFGTSINPAFGGVEETGILITISDIYEQKKKRHIASFDE